jgi:hypothetical protein
VKAKRRSIKTAICVDPMGSSFGDITPEMEIERHVEHFSEVFRPAKLNWYRIDSVSTRTIKPGTDLILFDFGGMLPGNSLMEDNSRRLIEWARDNPNSLCVVISDFTWRNAVKCEMDDMELSLPNVINDDYKLDDPIPAWFRNAVGVPFVRDTPKKATLASPLAGLTPLGGTLPNIKFFQPKPKFIKWMCESFGRKQVYDCGAGVGHVARALSDAGMRVTAIDANYRDVEEFEVEIADATRYSYPPFSVVLLARPCHGFFVEGVIEQALGRGASAIVYVGKSKNVRDDLADNYRHFKKELDLVGADREGAWVLRHGPPLSH